ncbi:hypothetical protein ACFLZ1_03060 [Patescibacteria group bacterium]
MKKKKLAIIISRVFDPIHEGLIIVFLISLLSPAKDNWVFIFFLSIILVYLLPWAFFFKLLKSGKISDWDITKRQERYLFYSFSFLSMLLFIVLIFFFQGKELGLFYLKILLPLFIYYLFTFIYKVSGHMFINSFLLVVLLMFFQNILFLVFGAFILILVGWSRIVLKKHTIFQVIIGTLLPFVVLLY